MRFEKIKRETERLFKVLSIAFVLAFAFAGNANAGNKSEDDEFDWTPVVDAMIQVESRGNANACHGQYAGVLQMSPAVVRACNMILKKQGSIKRYTLRDRFSEKKSREMFAVFMSYYNPTNNVEKAIRMWNGGPGYSVKGTNRYYRTVMKYVDFD